MATAQETAKYILGFARLHGDPISNLKLQKVVYYSQAWHLALFDQPLFNDRIEAWIHGPVAPAVYAEYRDWSWKPISVDIDLAAVQLTDPEKTHVEEVLEVYGGMSAYQLECLTHKEDPWIIARAATPADEPSSSEISHPSMGDFYRKINAAQNTAN